MPNLPDNATLIERLQFYCQTNQHEKGRALAHLGDFLEECYLWDVKFECEPR